VDHGVAVLLGFESRAAAQALLMAVTPTARKAQAALAAGDLACNLALSLEGLRMAGLTDAEVDMLPGEFVQGMERRAAVLGDLRINHPRRWRLPMRNWTDGAKAEDPNDRSAGERVPLEAVHAVLQIRRMRKAPDKTNPREELFRHLETLLKKAPGVKPLSLQWLHRLHSKAADGTPGGGADILDHFSFQDADTDPVLNRTQAGGIYANHVHLGEALIGHPNAGDIDAPATPNASEWMRKLLHNGSFLVIRKLRQDIAVLQTALAAATAPSIGLDEQTLKAKMMGRWPHGSVDSKGDVIEGRPLAKLPPRPRNPNDFDFEPDADASRCPFHAHIRRANPRAAPDAIGARPPRLFRRSLSYGPSVEEAGATAERGLFFMAYNASLGEQFEVVQRWLAGGNSSHGFSGQSDPFVGVPEPGRKRVFSFQHRNEADGHVHAIRMELDGNTDLLAEPKPIVRLEWGGYFFTPTLDALQKLAERAGEPAPGEQIAWSTPVGMAAIEALRRVEAEEGVAAAQREWKAALEDPQAAADFKTASIWAAIRRHHGGVLRTPYGVLVASSDAVGQLLTNDARALTSTGYLPRMRQSFGAIYLGMDPGQEDQRYEIESRACNDAIMALASDAPARAAIFDEAKRAVTAKLQELVDRARQYVQVDEVLRLNDGGGDPRDVLPWDLTVDMRELIDELLAVFCEKWFHLSEDGQLMRRSGFRWNWRPGDPPCYPGHFMAPSRYIFQPHPEEQVETVGIAHGQAIVGAMKWPG
jgi:deferrochelatase/peroxidase EfeB